MYFLPKTIIWVNPFELNSNGWQDVLVATHKHSHQDWEISFGAKVPIDNYTDYKITIGDREVPKNEILAIGLIRQYGSLNE